MEHATALLGDVMALYWLYQGSSSYSEKCYVLLVFSSLCVCVWFTCFIIGFSLFSVPPPSFLFGFRRQMRFFLSPTALRGPVFELARRQVVSFRRAVFALLSPKLWILHRVVNIAQRRVSAHMTSHLVLQSIRRMQDSVSFLCLSYPWSYRQQYSNLHSRRKSQTSAYVHRRIGLMRRNAGHPGVLGE